MTVIELIERLQQDLMNRPEIATAPVVVRGPDGAWADTQRAEPSQWREHISYVIDSEEVALPHVPREPNPAMSVKAVR
jgi:hypothetical protein